MCKLRTNTNIHAVIVAQKSIPVERYKLFLPFRSVSVIPHLVQLVFVRRTKFEQIPLKKNLIYIPCNLKIV